MGCVNVSEGCRNCYAETLTRNRMGLKLWGKDGRRQVTKTWRDPVKWSRNAAAAGVRERVFCASLCDVFEHHPTANEARPALWRLIDSCRSLDWQLLTKRPENIVSMLPADWGGGWPHVWLGTSIEDMRVAKRADHLRGVPAAVRFVSYEPALGSVADLDLSGIGWLICGGESGPGHRAMDHRWAREIRDKCAAAGVAFFFKQSSGARPGTGTLLDGVEIKNWPTTACRTAPEAPSAPASAGLFG